MAKHIEIYNADDYIYEDSKREYDEIKVVVTEVGDSAWDKDEMLTRSFYVDPLTGLLVADIATYEKWVR